MSRMNRNANDLFGIEIREPFRDSGALQRLIAYRNQESIIIGNHRARLMIEINRSQ